MIRSRSSLSTISCASWLVYATRATDDDAKRVMSAILKIKTDRVDAATGTPFVRLVIERIAARIADDARAVFGGHPMLVPVPGSSLTKPHTVWPSRRVCEELVGQGLGDDVLAIVSRTIAVPKSAGSVARPTLDQHVHSFSVQPGLAPPSRLLVVDDVVTSGTTMMACAIKLAQAFPGVPVSGFALARVQSAGNPDRVLDPIIQRVTIAGQRCKREPLA
jgi:predicted amidophosphoribosyltransferase